MSQTLGAEARKAHEARLRSVRGWLIWWVNFGIREHVCKYEHQNCRHSIYRVARKVSHYRMIKKSY